MMAGIGVPDAKELEGRKDGENRPSFQSRDFFWDSVTLFVVGAVLALSAIDLISEYVRGSEVQCFFSAVNESFENLGEYVNEKCAGSLPPAEYLPAFIAVHAILILAPHYIWLNVFGASIDSFFHLVSGLVRTREPTTGDYPESNYVISKQLDVFSCGTYRSNWMYYLYLLKLSAQFLICFGGFLLALLSFGDFDETFTCPANEGENMRYDWPLTGENVTCVFTSLRLLHKIWLIYLALLLVAILFLTFALVWLFTDHTKELGLDKVAKFSFQTSLPFHYYVPQLTLFQKLSHLPPTIHSILSFIPFFSIGSNSSYRIHSDYDFLLVKLFRTDGGLAQVLREVHLLRLLKDQNKVELARVSSHFSDIRDSGKVSSPTILKNDIGWSDFTRVEKHERIDNDTALLLPPTIRGVVLGMSARCVGSLPPSADHDDDDGSSTDHDGSPSPSPDPPNNLLCCALCIVFDSESVGFAGALARVFERVAVINFSKSYADYENPVHVNVITSYLVSVTAPHDIVMADYYANQARKGSVEWPQEASARFYDFVNEIWRRNYIYNLLKEEMLEAKGEGYNFPELPHYLTDYIVIGPTSSDLQRQTVDMFLKQNSHYMSPDAVLLHITPLEISGVKVNHENQPQNQNQDPYTPYNFTELVHKVPKPADVEKVMPTAYSSWPQCVSTSDNRVFRLTPQSSFPSTDCEVITGGTTSKMQFKMFISKFSTLAPNSQTTQSQTGATATTAQSQTGATATTAQSQTGATATTAQSQTGATATTTQSQTGATATTAQSQTGATATTTQSQTGATATTTQSQTGATLPKGATKAPFEEDESDTD